jgi:hypothetical protein
VEVSTVSLFGDLFVSAGFNVEELGFIQDLGGVRFEVVEADALAKLHYYGMNTKLILSLISLIDGF